jgi:hypothetical protein
MMAALWAVSLAARPGSPFRQVARSNRDARIRDFPALTWRFSPAAAPALTILAGAHMSLPATEFSTEW